MRQAAKNFAPPSVQDAVEQVMESGHRLVLDRIDLLQLDITQSLTDVARTMTLRIVAGLFAFAALIALSVAAAQGLSTWLPMAASTAIVGVVYAAGAGALIVMSNKPPRGGA